MRVPGRIRIGEPVGTPPLEERTVMQELPFAELAGQHTELLPAREALGGVNWADVSANNITSAVNIHSPHAKAFALGIQKVSVNQH
jgi:hypothetical protein